MHISSVRWRKSFFCFLKNEEGPFVRLVLVSYASLSLTPILSILKGIYYNLSK